MMDEGHVDDSHLGDADPPFAQAVDAIVVASPQLMPVAPIRPRIWTAISVSLLAILFATIVSAIVVVFALLLMSGGKFGSNPSQMLTLLEDMVRTPWGLFAMVVPGQLTFLVSAMIAARLSPLSITHRLDLKHGHLPKWLWVVLALATPSVGFVVSMVMYAMKIELSEQLKSINEMLIGQEGWGLVATLLLVALIPGCVEEVLFRGYLQSRLLRRWSPWTAITVSAAIFAIAHVDPLHALAVFPIGVWLGFVAWKAGSILPSMIGHTANNGIAIVMAQFQDEMVQDVGIMDFVIIIPSGLAMIASLLLLRRYGIAKNDRALLEDDSQCAAGITVENGLSTDPAGETR